MKRSTFAALAAAVALPLFSAPALAQGMGPYGYTPSDDFPYGWAPDRSEDNSRWITRGGPDRPDARWSDRRGYDDGRGGMRELYGSMPDSQMSRWEFERARREAYERGYTDARRESHDPGYDRGGPEEGYAAGHRMERGPMGGEWLPGMNWQHDYRMYGRGAPRGMHEGPGPQEAMREMPDMQGMQGMHGIRGMDEMHEMRGMGDMHGMHGMRGMGDMHGMHGRGGHHGMDGARRLREMVEIYDQDGDGRVTQDEVDKFRSDRLQQFDSNGDGSLSLDEYQALWLDAMRERMVDQFQEHDADGDGKVTTDEFSRATRDVVGDWDRDRDRAVSASDFGGGHEDHQRSRRPQVEAPLGGSTDAPKLPATTQPSSTERPEQGEQAEEPSSN